MSGNLEIPRPDPDSQFLYPPRAKANHLDTAGAWSFLVLPEIDQQLAETLLSGATGAARGALARNINQLSNALPAGTSGGGILSVGKELLSFGTGVRTVLIGLVVIGNVEVVNVFLRLLDGGVLLLSRDLCTAGDLSITLLAPFTFKFENYKLAW